MKITLGDKIVTNSTDGYTLSIPVTITDDLDVVLDTTTVSALYNDESNIEAAQSYITTKIDEFANKVSKLEIGKVIADGTEVACNAKLAESTKLTELTVTEFKSTLIEKLVI